MTERRVRFTQTANQHIDRERAWWLANRDHQELFATEIESAIKMLALLPGAGTSYADGETPGLRRLYIRKLACHFYYTFDAEEVIVRALWCARRDRGPEIW